MMTPEQQQEIVDALLAVDDESPGSKVVCYQSLFRIPRELFFQSKDDVICFAIEKLRSMKTTTNEFIDKKIDELARLAN